MRVEEADLSYKRGFKIHILNKIDSKVTNIESKEYEFAKIDGEIEPPKMKKYEIK